MHYTMGISNETWVRACAAYQRHKAQIDHIARREQVEPEYLERKLLEWARTSVLSLDDCINLADQCGIDVIGKQVQPLPPTAFLRMPPTEM